MDSRALIALVAAHGGEPHRLAAEVAAAQKLEDEGIARELDPTGVVAEAIREAP